MKQPLQRKLLYSYIAVTVLILAGVSIAISVLLREYFLASKQQELVSKGYELSRVVESYHDGRIDNGQLTSFINAVDPFLDARIWIIDSNHKVVAVSSPRRPGLGMGRGPGGGAGMGPGMMQGQGMMGGGMLQRNLVAEFEPVLNGQVVAKSFYHPIYDENVLLVAVPVAREDGTLLGAVVLNAPVKGINQFLVQIYYYIGGIGLLALLVMVVVARSLAKGITNPLKEMQQSASAMARGDYNARIEVESDDEVGELGKSLNTLAQELARFVSNTARTEKLRRDFIANISHELRTPLTLIRGYTEALLDGTITRPEQAEKSHRLMRDETIRLEGLINELLDLSRLQAASTKLEMESVPLAAIAEGVVAMLRQRAEQGAVTLELLAPDGDSVISGNGDRLTQLLLILLDNALKFTPATGKVTVTVVRESEAVILTVADTGAGISQEDLPFIWERFYKADKSHTRSEAGTGLGLAIAREIIERHGANSVVESRPGEGTVFKITFPVS
ncbi:MAG: ATP-binding protein [Negativicutes bacterium]|nr:ATP-binding protein [Negativicutes bacterium]